MKVLCINKKNLTPWKRKANKTQDPNEGSMHSTKKSQQHTLSNKRKLGKELRQYIKSGNFAKQF
jgi:hypothetical protein